MIVTHTLFSCGDVLGIPKQLGIGNKKGTLLYVASVVAVEKEVPSVTVVSFSSVVTLVAVGTTVSIIEIFVNL